MTKIYSYLEDLNPPFEEEDIFMLNEVVDDRNLTLLKRCFEKGLVCTPTAINYAASNRDFEMIKFLGEKGYKMTSYGFGTIIANEDWEIYNYLVKNSLLTDKALSLKEEFEKNKRKK